MKGTDMNLYYIESDGYNPWENLAIEAVIAEMTCPGDVCLYLWQNDKTVVIGKGQNALRECRGELLESEGGYLARRTTGGGAVYHDLGNLCFTFAASPEVYDLERQMRVVMKACEGFGLHTQLSGRNDIITDDGFKFSGNAFSIKKTCRIQHGTLMVDVDAEALQRYLTPSQLKLKAKGIASVRSRVCNLKQLCPGITVEKLKKALLEAFCAEYAPGESGFEEQSPLRILRREDLDSESLARYTQLFSSWEWRYGRSPACELTFEHLFPWGEVQIHLHLVQMKIEDCRVYSDCLDAGYAERMREFLTGRFFNPGTWNADSRDIMVEETVRYLAAQAE